MTSSRSQERILLCLYSFPPLGGPRAIRWLHLAKTLSERGWAIDVLTVRPSTSDSFYDESLLEALPSGIRVFRTYPGVFYSLIHFKKRPVRGFPKTTIEWLPFGLIQGRRMIKSHQYSAIISSALPFVGHIVGYFLKRWTQTPWVADYGDLFKFNPVRSKTKRLVGGIAEHYLLNEADALIVPFEEMKEEFLNYYPFLKTKKISAIQHGISEDIDSIKSAFFENKFMISYVGSFYKNDREPYQFFRGLSLLKKESKIMDNIRVIIAGNTEQRYINFASRLGLTESVEFLRHVDFHRAVSILKGSSTILYLGGKKSGYHFPSKILVSAASGRPIIGVRQSPRDLGADFIDKNNLGIVVSMDTKEIAKAIQRLYGQWENNTLDKSFKPIRKEDYYWRERGKELEAFLLSVIKENSE